LSLRENPLPPVRFTPFISNTEKASNYLGAFSVGAHFNTNATKATTAALNQTPAKKPTATAS